MTRADRPILLTGFGPFPGVGHNVSGELAARLADHAATHFPKRRIVTETLNVDWNLAPRVIKRLYKREKPAVAVHFGVSDLAKGFVLETTARNHCRPIEDAFGSMPKTARLAAKGADTILSTIPMKAIHRRLGALGLNSELSDDAGGYLCNAVLYQAASLAASLAAAAGHEPPPRVGFVHVPVRIPGEGLDWEKALEGGLEIIRMSLGLPQRRGG